MTVLTKSVSRLALVVMATVALSACVSSMAQPSKVEGFCPMKANGQNCCAGMSKADMKGCCDMPCCQGK